MLIRTYSEGDLGTVVRLYGKRITESILEAMNRVCDRMLGELCA